MIAGSRLKIGGEAMIDLDNIDMQQLVAPLPPEDLKSDSIDAGEPHALHRRGDRFNCCAAHHGKYKYGLTAISAAL
jgi:hypothetical protein